MRYPVQSGPHKGPLCRSERSTLGLTTYSQGLSLKRGPASLSVVPGTPCGIFVVPPSPLTLGTCRARVSEVTSFVS